MKRISASPLEKSGSQPLISAVDFGVRSFFLPIANTQYCGIYFADGDQRMLSSRSKAADL
jgi:hypothetical protein